MNKRKLFYVLASILAFSLLSVGCTDLSDVAPKKYGDWDGNYIYLGNVRSKTTGADEEYLVESVEREGIEYTVTELNGFEYVEDDIYMCLAVRSGESSTTCLTVYNIKDKTADVVYWETNGLSANDIYKITENYIILIEENSDLFRVDHEGNLLSADENRLYGFSQTEEYLLNYENGEFFYWTWADETPKSMFTVTDEVNSLQTRYVKEGAKEGFLMQVMTDSLWNRLYFYDISSQTVQELLSLDHGEYVLRGNHLVTGDRTVVTYTTIDKTYKVIGKTQTHIPEIHTTTHTFSLYQNCKLYRLDWSQPSMLTFAYDFSKDYPEYDFSHFTELEDDKVFFQTNKIVQYKGVESCYFVLDVQTGKLSQTKENMLNVTAEEQLELIREMGVTCGKYVYYHTEKGYGFGRLNVTHTLWRYNTETGEEEAMQFWTDSCRSDEGYYTETVDDETVTYRYSAKMWIASGIHDEEGSFIIRNY